MAEYKKDSNKEIYSVMEIDVTARRFLSFAVALATVTLTIVIFLYIQSNRNENGYLLWALLMLSVLLAVPISEHWVYRPWQNNPQKIESQKERH